MGQVIRWSLKQTQAPAVEPVSLSDMKARLRVTVTDDDTDIGLMITEARAMCENECSRAFITQNYTMYLNGFPIYYPYYWNPHIAYPMGLTTPPSRMEIRLPRAPLQSVTSIAYYDTAGDIKTLNPDLYWVTQAHEPGIISPIWNTIWPFTNYAQPDSVQIAFVAGYGNAASNCPPEVVAAIKSIVVERYQHRGDGVDVGIPNAARRLLDSLEWGEVR